MNLKTLALNVYLQHQHFRNYEKFNPKLTSQKTNLRNLRCRRNLSIITNCSVSSHGADNAAQISPIEREKEVEVVVVVVEKTQFLEETLENSRRELSENQSLLDQIIEIVKFSGPAVGLWICGPLMSLIDTAVVGQGSSIELAALGIYTSIFSIF